jgi:ABC-2 type transport system ATP-binding protein
VLGLDPQAEPRAVRGRVGYLPGELRLDDNRTADAVFRFFNRLRGGRADPRYIRQLAERLGLDLRTPIKNFSRGNKQKVGLVQALMHRPELLILDEPTSGLDPLAQQEAHRLIAAARAEGATVFFSSHVLSEVQEVAERVAILRGGAVVEVAATAALIDRALRRVRVRFREPPDSLALDHLPGIKILGRDDRGGVLLQVSGEMDGLIKALAAFPVSDFETERPSLEEVFLAYYEGDPDRPGEK